MLGASTGEHVPRFKRARLGRALAQERQQQGVGNMRGVITGREVLENLGLIYREFGAACVLRCLWALVRGRSTTFLEVACQPETRPERYR